MNQCLFVLVQENCADRTFKTVVAYAVSDEIVFLCIFRMASIRSPVFEIASVVYAYNCDEKDAKRYFCRIKVIKNFTPFQYKVQYLSTRTSLCDFIIYKNICAKIHVNESSKIKLFCS